MSLNFSSSQTSLFVNNYVNFSPLANVQWFGKYQRFYCVAAVSNTNFVLLTVYI